MSEANKEIVRKAYAALNAHDFDGVAALIADSFVEHEVTPGIEPNKAGALAFFTSMVAAFPDFQMKIEDMAAEADKVFIRGTMSGTQKAEFMGIPPSGKSFSVAVGDFIRIEDGLVREHWGVSDMASMMQQLGVTEMPG